MTCVELAKFHQRSIGNVSEIVVPADGPRDTATGQVCTVNIFLTIKFPTQPGDQ